MGPRDLQLGLGDTFGVNVATGCYTDAGFHEVPPETTLCVGSLTGDEHLGFYQSYPSLDAAGRAHVEVGAREFADGNIVFDVEPTQTPGLFELIDHERAVASINTALVGSGEMRVLFGWQNANGEERFTFMQCEEGVVRFYAELYLRLREIFLPALREIVTE